MLFRSVAAPGAQLLNSYTTNTSIAWARGTYAFTSSSTFTLTVTNPTSGPPGVGNDGEIMTFVNLSAKTNAVVVLQWALRWVRVIMLSGVSVPLAAAALFNPYGRWNVCDLSHSQLCRR